jgi:cell division protein FtsW (lipid II flippase)
VKSHSQMKDLNLKNMVFLRLSYLSNFVLFDPYFVLSKISTSVCVVAIIILLVASYLAMAGKKGGDPKEWISDLPSLVLFSTNRYE